MRTSVLIIPPLALAWGLVGLPNAVAAQSTDTIDCAGHTLTIRANSSNSSEKGGWSSVQVVDGGSGHLTPVSFRATLTDTTTGQSLGSFTTTKGNGQAQHTRDTVECTDSIVSTLAEFIEDPSTLPPGAALTDAAVLDFTAVVVVQG